ncbi:Toxin [Caenorhabditis elegans]|uniref:Toxin n=1 Tax=Caenorhabditis elegans TaxID=6239 RepID=O45596_CAEEL|nr:Toxin [Caenorhabditis elegans]CAB05526.1 Toxin [Caenorhabditis elegans]|eukprot:NP_497018.1 Uncharacterized protein CELE_F57C2.4 [Caenorhabditis elegans]
MKFLFVICLVVALAGGIVAHGIKGEPIPYSTETIWGEWFSCDIERCASDCRKKCEDLVGFSCTKPWWNPKYSCVCKCPLNLEELFEKE